MKKSRKQFPESRSRTSNVRSIEKASGQVLIPALRPQNVEDARKEIARRVREYSVEIVEKMINSALEGEVPPAKYLFELVGLYPAVEASSSSDENALARTLLEQMGLPTEIENS